MSSKSWFSVMMIVCLSAMLATGCSTKPKSKPVTGVPDGRVTPIYIEEVDESALAARPVGIQTPVAANLDSVLFGYDSFQVADKEVVKIQQVADFMKSSATVQATCEGNCDERGSAEYNMALGENRALAVRAYLIQLGVDGGRIQTKSFGEDNPVDARHCEEAWQQNRRVDFVLFE